MGKFHYLKFGLSLVLVFAGGKMVLSDVYELPIWASLVVIAGLLGGSVVASLLKPPTVPPVPVHPPHGGPLPQPPG